MIRRPRRRGWCSAARSGRSTNYVESFTAFAALDLAFIALHWSAGIWPTVWIVARIVYLPLYLFGVDLCALARLGRVARRHRDDARPAGVGLMPTVAIADGDAIRFSAQIAISPRQVLRGSLPSAKLKTVIAWATGNREGLMDAWLALEAGRKPRRLQ